MIDIQGLEKKFNDRAIFSGLNLKLEKGKVYALIGKSGSGKTTLLNILGKLEKIDGGRVLYQGKDLKTIPTREYFRDQMGYLFQNFGLLENQSIKENLDLEQKIYTLSGGEAQRVSLAKTILKNPPLILADEPTAALDPENSEEVMNLLVDLKDENRIIIIATHNPLVWNKADEIIDMRKLAHV
ncbi:TPA: ATP-binding cassette domain-containing protein [Streptococcus pneumoniae]